MFGVPAKVGLENTSLPREIWKKLKSKEDVQKVISEHSTNQHSPNQGQREESHSIKATPVLEEDSRIKPVWDNSNETILKKKNAARDSLTHQTKEMKHDSNAKFPDPLIGATVRVSLPDINWTQGNIQLNKYFFNITFYSTHCSFIRWSTIYLSSQICISSYYGEKQMTDSSNWLLKTVTCLNCLLDLNLWRLLEYL